ncbi:MAG: hypothetical protein MJZ64_05450 [Paludibacteraceae bacterium]|nr:hypothetical protein [Paludibacteraceae bacterium]
MSFTITDTELENIIQKASAEAAKEAAKNAVAELIAKQGKKAEQEEAEIPPIQQASESEAKQTLEAMAANLDKQESPKVGIFWYQEQGERLFGVVAVNKDSFAKPNVGGGLITCTELHKDVWKKRFHEQKYKLKGEGPFIGDYKDHCRGRVFYNPTTDTYQIMVGSWINNNRQAIAMIVEEFNLTNVHYEVKTSYHWDIGNGWENQ